MDDYIFYAVVLIGLGYYLKFRRFWFTSVRFLDKTVWVTGASSGIGRQLALAFSAAGATVILTARNEANLNEVANRCISKAIVMPIDLEQGQESLKKA